MKNNYALKLQIKKQIEREMIEREMTERILWLSIIALNETEGVNLGKERIQRFANKLVETSNEFSNMRKTDGDDVAFTKIANRISKIMGEEYRYIR